ncbi:MAG: tetratricopeptide repeat protein [Gemmatimonadales bacterium]
MRAFRVLQALFVAALGGAGVASAQLAVSRVTEKMLVLPFAAAPAESAASITLADALRERLAQSAKRWVQVIPKSKLCEALRASGFPCDGLLDDQQARQLARFLQVEAYVTGTLERESGALAAQVRSFDIQSSGMAAGFSVTDANPATPLALAEKIAERLTLVIRNSEHVRDCTQERQRGQFNRARDAAEEALENDPNSTGAHLCIATVYEAQRMPVDSIIAASERALRGDPLNATAWENIARGYQQKGDTVKMIEAFTHQLEGDQRNTGRRLAIAQLLRQLRQYQKAVDLIDAGLAIMPGEPQLIELKTRICIEGSLYRCALDGLMAQAQNDSSVLADTTFLKPAIGAAQQVADTQALLRLSAAAVRNFPNDLSFLKVRGAAFELAGQTDSAIVVYREALRRDPRDVATSLLIAKTIVDHAVWDTAEAGRLKSDTAALGRLRRTFGAKVDSAWTYLRPGLRAADSTERLSAAVIALTGGSKLAQAGAYDQAHVWLDTLLQVVTPRVPGDTSGPRHQIRVNASFWYGLASVLTLSKPYQEMTKLKATDPGRCDVARGVFNRLDRTKAALQLGRRVHPPTADQMLGFVDQYERAKPQVARAFKCRNL